MSCTKQELVDFIREHSADCLPDNHKRSEAFISQAINLAIQQVVADKSDEFQETVQVTLTNGECIHSTCEQCSGVVRLAGNVNGNCTDPIQPKEDDREKDSYYSGIYSAHRCPEVNSTGEYKIEKFEVLGDGGCEFKVSPVVPSTGVHKVYVLCVVTPDIDGAALPEALCRHFYLIATAALVWIYTFEADSAMQIKAKTFSDLYASMLKSQRDTDAGLFIDSIRFGTRLNSSDD